MREEESGRPQTSPSSSSTIAAATVKKEEGLFGRGKYKLWALAAITLLALWSMFTGTVTLKWSDVNLQPSSDPFIHADLDVLDVDEREKMVKQMWNVYKHSSLVRLPSFWRDAFGAAYQDLISEVASVRKNALIEIAKMSFRSSDIYAPPIQSTSRASNEEDRPRMKMRKTRKLK
ncbi:hypothetical protein ACS0TY_013494 [Phlomoides rotata]